MLKEQDNKEIVGRWFTEFWGSPWNPKIVDELAAPDILLQYSLHSPRRGREDVKAFMNGFREAFPDLSFAGAADFIAEGDLCGRSLGGRWERTPALLSATFSPVLFPPRPEDAVHGNHGASRPKRQDCGGSRTGRWGDRVDPAWPHPRIVYLNCYNSRCLEDEAREMSRCAARLALHQDLAHHSPLLGFFRQRLPRPEHDASRRRLESFPELLLELGGGESDARPVGLAHLDAGQSGRRRFVGKPHHHRVNRGASSSMCA